MSFERQQELMLELLFDRSTRERFIADPAGVLETSGLDADEQVDFLAIRTDGLQFDASLRIDLMLSQMVKTWPLSFALVCSYPGGKKHLMDLVDLALIRHAPEQRAVHFGLGVQQWLGRLRDSDGLLERVQAIQQAELAMAYTTSQLMTSGSRGAIVPAVLPQGWQDQALQLAPFTSVAVLPLPYARLKQALSPCDGPALWQHLSVSPPGAESRQQWLGQPDFRLLLARAMRVDDSACDPVIEFTTMELAAGFALLFQHVDGHTSMNGLSVSMRQAGATPGLLASIESGFRQLLEKGLLQCGSSA